MTKIFRYTNPEDYAGYYQVNGIQFLSKFKAFAACGPGQCPSWHWFDEEFSSIDWKVEPAEDLYDIYRRRAEQIRAKYDYLVLCWSGGVDSLVALRSFVDNGIKLDAVISSGAWSINNPEKYYNNSEIYNVALPYIQELRSTKNFDAPHWLIDDTPYYQELTNPNTSWLDRINGRTVSVRIAPMNLGLLRDPRMQALNQKGTIGLVTGIEKPKLLYENNTWKYSFLDICAGYVGIPTTDTNSTYEHFFWAPDMPELVCKQAYVIKNYFEQTGLIHNQDLITKCFQRDNHLHDRALYTNYVDPLVYGRYITQKPGEPRNYYTLGKFSTGAFYKKEDAFWEVIATDRMKFEYFDQLAKIVNNIDPRFVNNRVEGLSVEQFAASGLIGIFTKDYCLS
jgi:hypothetical protein